MSQPRIYFDYAASTPVDKRVERTMRPYFGMKFGNPGSLHSFGQEAMAAIDRYRESIAKAIGADFREIIFTASATEANNLALRGVVESFAREQKVVPRLIVSAVEHESVLETARDLERDGVEVVYLPVKRNGIVDLKKFASALNERTALVSVMYGQNEIGTIQPVVEISKIISNFKQSHRGGQTHPVLHTDAAQAFQFLDCNVINLGVHLMTISAHKIYGPKGVGALYVKNGAPLSPVTTGGAQEFGLRSGTENVPLIVGFGKAVELITKDRASLVKKTVRLRNYFLREAKKQRLRVELNGAVGEESLPHILNLYFPGQSAEELLTRLDLAGVALSSGSACRSRSFQPSYVIEALGYSRERAKQSVRFSFGKPTTKSDIDKALLIVKKSISVKSQT